MRTGTLVSCVMLVEMPGHDDVVMKPYLCT